MKLETNKREAVSPVIATLLLIAIAVAAGIVLYVFVSGLTTSLSNVRGTVTQPLQVTVTSVTKSTGGGPPPTTVWQLTLLVVNPNGAGITITQGIITDNTGAQIQTVSAFASTSAAGTCSSNAPTASVSGTANTGITVCFSSITGLNSGNTFRITLTGSDAAGNQYSSNPAVFTLR